MEIEFNGIHPQERKKIGLIKSAGRFIPYNGEAPEIFSQPLLISDNSNAYISGVESSDVSALVPHGGAYYKIKRCKPSKARLLTKALGEGFREKTAGTSYILLKRFPQSMAGMTILLHLFIR